MKIRGIGISLLVIGFCLFINFPSMAQSSQVQLGLKTIIKRIEKTTSYHFLYRDALVAGIKLPVYPNSEGLLASLENDLPAHNIGIQVDTTRKQVLIYELSHGINRHLFYIGGQVVDASSGARLPAATVSWESDGELQGTSTGENGNFQLIFNPIKIHHALTIGFSYIGYKPVHVTFTPTSHTISDLTIRLKPKQFIGHEVVITGSSFDHSDNRDMKSFVQLGSFSPVGESSTIRSLELYPSVSLNVGLHEGLDIRGSASDGLRVFLDGATIYNLSHLFGLLDIFNSNALQLVGFDYDITPAQYPGVLGGILSYMTRTGSQTKNKATVGLSNTAYSATLEGPIAKGKGSWLISGRHSYMNAINWFNNQYLVGWGLNVDRSTSPIGKNQIALESKTTFPKKPKADFYDLHAKLLYELPKGSRFVISSYVGGDLTSQDANNYVPVSASPNLKSSFALKNFRTKNNWGNAAVSLQYSQPVFNDVYSHSLLAYSYYHSYFYKQNFLYVQKTDKNGTTQIFHYPFENKNNLNDIKIEQNYDIPTQSGLLNVGATFHNYNILYEENSVLHPGFVENFKSSVFNLFSEYDITHTNHIHLHLGIRGTYFSNGNYLRFSPRIKIHFLPDSPVSFGLGFSRSYQFIHKMSFYYKTSSDLWILSTKGQGPSSLTYWSSGIYIKPQKSMYFQAEAYIKNFYDLRVHDIGSRALSQTNIDSPWFYNNRGFARGIELLYQQHIGKIIWNTTYTWSKILLQNPQINNGKKYYAAWDRRNKFSTSIEWPLFKYFTIYANWLFATGAPNQLVAFSSREKARLPDYHRLDVSLKFHKTFTTNLKIDASVSAFDLLNVHNVWYREYKQVIDESSNFAKLEYTPVYVYDLGFQPSFNLTIHF